MYQAPAYDFTYKASPVDPRHHRGMAAEEEALRLYAKAKFEILDTNYRFGHYQVDFIAKRAGIIHFVEVKYRRDIMDAHRAITAAQLRRIAEAGQNFMRDYPDDLMQVDAILFDQNMNWERIDNIVLPMHIL